MQPYAHQPRLQGGAVTAAGLLASNCSLHPPLGRQHSAALLQASPTLPHKNASNEFCLIPAPRHSCHRRTPMLTSLHCCSWRSILRWPTPCECAKPRAWGAQPPCARSTTQPRTWAGLSWTSSSQEPASEPCRSWPKPALPACLCRTLLPCCSSCPGAQRLRGSCRQRLARAGHEGGRAPCRAALPTSSGASLRSRYAAPSADLGLGGRGHGAACIVKLQPCVCRLLGSQSRAQHAGLAVAVVCWATPLF